MTGAPRQPRRLVYLGTPDLAVAPLRALHAAGHDVALVVSRPDKRRGRGRELMPSPVKAAALELGLNVSDSVDDVVGSGAELGVVVAFGRIIKPHVLAAVPMVNLHFSLLPRWRGAAPVERAILAGDATTGVCVMAVEEGLDTGGIYRSATLPIGDDDTLEELRRSLVDSGTALLLNALSEGLGDPRPQVGEPVYAAKIEPTELHLDWSRPAVELHRVVRLGGAWTTFRGKRLKVWRTSRREADVSLESGQVDGVLVGTGDGVLELIEVQPEGKGRIHAAAWHNGAHPTADDRLGR